MKLRSKKTQIKKVRFNTQGYDMAVTFLLAMKYSTQTFSAKVNLEFGSEG